MENFKFKSSLFHSVHNPQGIFIHILINSGLMWKMCWNYFILVRFSELRKWQFHVKYCDAVFCMRIVPIWSFSGPYFPTFARNTEGEILRISPHSVQMGGNTNQKNSEYKQFSRSALRVKNKLLFSASVFAFYYSQLNLHKYL